MFKERAEQYSCGPPVEAGQAGIVVRAVRADGLCILVDASGRDTEYIRLVVFVDLFVADPTEISAIRALSSVQKCVLTSIRMPLVPACRGL